KEIPHGLQWHAEGFNFGGIWQPVELLETDRIYLSDIFIEPKLTGGAVEAHIELTNKLADTLTGKVRVLIRPWKQPDKTAGQSEKSVQVPPGTGTVDVHVDVPDRRPWSPDDPFLYVAEVSIADAKGIRHSANVRFGFREFTVKDGYLNLNGR